MRIRVLALVLAVVAAAATGSALRAQKPSGPFASVTALRCSFPVYATAVWTQPVPDVSSARQDFTFQIEAIDLKKKNAEIVGAGGSALAAVVLTETGLSVIEQTPIGNLNITTVFAAGGTGSTFLAVHSRHLGDVSGPPHASQSYGTCQPERK
jgi:hypothetical protein